MSLVGSRVSETVTVAEAPAASESAAGVTVHVAPGSVSTPAKPTVYCAWEVARLLTTVTVLVSVTFLVTSTAPKETLTPPDPSALYARVWASTARTASMRPVPARMLPRAWPCWSGSA